MSGPVASVRAWSLWRAPASVLALVLTVYAAAGAAAFPITDVSRAEISRFIALAIVGSACSLLCLRMERARKTLERGNVPNLTAVWTFAGALCLEHTLALVLVVVVYGVQWFTQRSLFVGRPHRYVFSAATVIIGARLAQESHIPVLSGAIFMATNIGLVACAMVASGAARNVRHLADVREQSIDVATLVLGYATASLLDVHLVLSVTAVPIILAVQYWSLRAHAARSSTLDPRTGALTTLAWNALATLRLSQTKDAIVFVVLIIDPHGRPMELVAKTLREGLRSEDLIGLADGGFSVLVAEPGGTLLAATLALQIRARLAGVGIDTVLGSAVTPDGGSPVDLQGLTVSAAASAIIQAADLHV